MTGQYQESISAGSSTRTVRVSVRGLESIKCLIKAAWRRIPLPATGFIRQKTMERIDPTRGEY